MPETSNMKIRSYGVTEYQMSETDTASAVEQLTALGYCVVDGGYTKDELATFSTAFESARLKAANDAGGSDRLREINEHNSVRALLSYEPIFRSVAMNPNVRKIAREAVADYHILTQQNGVINPPKGETYSQAVWHRDLPYQHNVFSRPIAINALFCLDEFTNENGATLVLPASHKNEAFPSERYVEEQLVQITAPAGHFIVLDCMCYHAGAENQTEHERRAVNQVYAMPHLRQQIDLPEVLGKGFPGDDDEKRFLGYDVSTPRSVSEYLNSRRK